MMMVVVVVERELLGVKDAGAACMDCFVAALLLYSSVIICP